MSMLEIRDLWKAYTPGTPVLQGINLTVEPGEIVCLLGPSGCGKSTLLRLIAGLDQPDRGSIDCQGQDLRTTPVHQRNFGLMFQEFALFPHRTVGENIAFGLRMAGKRRPEIACRVDEMLALVNLEGYAQRSIFDLSGGERQRVALARSLAPSPRLLMLDEPLGSLDRVLREELMNELRAILKRVGVTAIYVTHDQQEAFAIGDRLVVMQQGEIEQVGAPEAVYAMPATVFVARFLGFANLLPVAWKVTTPEQITTPLGALPLPPITPHPLVVGSPYTLLIRPDAVRALLPMDQPCSSEFCIQGRLQNRSFRGNYYRIEVVIETAVDPITLYFEIPSEQDIGGDRKKNKEWRPLPAVGEQAQLLLHPAQLMLLPGEK